MPYLPMMLLWQGWQWQWLEASAMHLLFMSRHPLYSKNTHRSVTEWVCFMMREDHSSFPAVPNVRADCHGATQEDEQRY
jgi:hypothetical protein